MSAMSSAYRGATVSTLPSVLSRVLCGESWTAKQIERRLHSKEQRGSFGVVKASITCPSGMIQDQERSTHHGTRARCCPAAGCEPRRPKANSRGSAESLLPSPISPNAKTLQCFTNLSWRRQMINQLPLSRSTSATRPCTGCCANAVPVSSSLTSALCAPKVGDMCSCEQKRITTAARTAAPSAMRRTSVLAIMLSALSCSPQLVAPFLAQQCKIAGTTSDAHQYRSRGGGTLSKRRRRSHAPAAVTEATAGRFGATVSAGVPPRETPTAGDRVDLAVLTAVC